MTLHPKSSRIVVHSNLIEFFKGLVRDAIRNQNLDTDEMAEFYLVHLLAEFHKTEKMSARCPKTGEEEPWAITYLRAVQSETTEKINLLKGLGDRSLYLSGIFSEFLESTPVGINYFMSLGGNAYTHLADMVATTQSDLQDLFKELSDKFSPFVDILSEVSESAGMGKDKDLLKLYERWLRTSNPRLGKALIKAGIPLNNIKRNILQ